jgi:VWFA-related protein
VLRHLLIVLAVLLPRLASGQQDAPVPPAPRTETASAVPSLRITSPLGRTGIVTRVRIVAQAHLPPGTQTSAVEFYVDGDLVGTVDAANGPPYAVDWLDQNPFERRELMVQAADASGRVIRDAITLPGFEIEDITEVTSILLETGVYDADGRSVNSLDAASFVVREDGVDQVIDLVTRETLPTTLLLLVDNSQSMHRRLEFIRRATARLAAALGPRDAVIVAPFNAVLGTITGPTQDSGTIANAIESMRAVGGTAILDSLAQASLLLRGLEGRRAIVLVTDGYDENSKTAPEAVLQAAAEAQATLYVIGIGGVAGISLQGERLLRRLADETGGRVFFPPREIDLVAVADDVATDTHSRYLIAYTPSNRKKDGAWREIAVEVPEGLRARTRTGYFAPDPPPIRPTIEFTVTNSFQDFVNVTADDLQVMENGVAQIVDTFQEAVDPLSIVLTIDASGSMKNAAPLVQQTAREFVTAVRDEDSLALITFADEPKFAHTLSTTREWTLTAIDKYVPLGGTALYDALWNSLMHLKDVKGRRAVVVLTDGRDENNPGTAPGSVHVLDEVLKLGRDVGATVFAIGLGARVDRETLERVTDATGGAAYFAADAEDLGNQFRMVIENLRRRYILSYTSTDRDRDGAWREVEILPKLPGYVVSSAGGYFAPASN